MIRRLGIGKYLLLSMSILVFVTLGMGLFAFINASTNVKEMSDITERIANDLLRSQRLLSAFASLHARFSPLVSENEIDELEKLSQDIDAGYREVETILKECGDTCSDHHALYTDYKAKFQTAADKYLKSGDRPSAMHAMMADLDPQWKKALFKFNTDRATLTITSSNLVKKSRETARDIKFTILVMMAGASGMALAIGLVIRRALVSHISGLADDLVNNSSQLKSASTQLSSSSMGLSNAVSQQSVALQESMSSLEEMSKVVERNAEYAKSSEDRAQESQSTVESGKLAMQDMLTALGEITRSNELIREETDTNSREFDQIVKVISEIGNKTKVINEIVFQTKLLSFNASVEAARAGEHGRGFSVVAEEVGNLAKMSGRAAEEIAALLSSSTELVTVTVARSRDRVAGFATESKSKMESGVDAAKRCNLVFDQITMKVQEVTHMVREISTASQEQSIGVAQITKTVNQLEQLSHQNAGVATETAAAAQQISGQAGHLNDAVSGLRTLLEGERNHAERFTASDATTVGQLESGFSDERKSA